MEASRGRRRCGRALLVDNIFFSFHIFLFLTLGGWLLVKNIWSVLDEAGTQYGGADGDQQVGAGPRQGARSAVSNAVLVA